MPIEIVTAGMTPICPCCGYIMQSSQMHRGEKTVVVWCGYFNCVSKGKKFRVTLPTVQAEEVVGE